MRLMACRGGLSAAAAVVLLTACGGSDGEDSASSESRSPSASSSSAPATTDAPADSEFCTQASAVLDEVVSAFTSGGSDPSAVATALQDAAADVRAIDPPAEIEQDWTALADRIDQAFAGVDLNDPAAATEVQQRTGELIGSLSTSATNVQNYLSQECGIDVGAPGPAAPTS